MRYRGTLVTVLLAAMVLPAQAMRLYGTGTEQAACVAVSPIDSSVYVVGKNDTSATTSEMLIIRYDSAGAFLGEHRYVYGDNCEGVDVLVEPSGRVYVLARGEIGAFGSDVIVLEYSSSLGLVASATYSHSATSVDRGTKLVRHPFGLLYVVGETDTGTGSFDVLVLSYTASLALNWSTVWAPSPTNDRVTCAEVNKWGLYVGGEINVGGATSLGFVSRFNASTGAFIFHRVVSGAALQPTYVADLHASPSGPVYYVATQAVGAGDSRVRVVRTSLGLTGTVWTQVYGRGIYEDIGNKIRVAGPYVVVGATSFLPAPIAYDAVCLTFDRATGSPLGTAVYHLVDSDFVFDMHVESSGDAYLTWISDYVPLHEYLVWKVNASATLWSWRYGGPGHAEPFCLKYDRSAGGSVLVTGRVALSAFGGWLFGTEKLDSTTGAALW